MKIIFCRWNSICERGITRAFEELGYELVPFDRRFSSVDYDKEYLALLAEKIILNRDADIVFSINYMPIIARVCKNFNIKYVSWIVDSPCFQLYSETLAFDTNRVCLFDRAQYNKFAQINPEGIFYFPLGSDIKYWDNVKISKSDYQEYGADVAFIGSLYSEKCMYNAIENDLPEYIKGYARGLIEAQTKVYGYYFLDDAITDKWAEEFKSHVKWNPVASDYTEDVKGIVSDMYLGQKCTELERIRLFDAISKKFNFDLWTLSDTSMFTKVNVRGGADSESMMPKIIKCSKINLNLTNRPIKTGLPLRIFDILGCGGFLISNYQEEIPEILEPDKDIVLFDSEEDLIDKIDFYLKHDELRTKTASNGYEKVKKDYSYTERIKKMFELVM